MKYLCKERELFGCFARLCDWADFLGVDIWFDEYDNVWIMRGRGSAIQN